MKKIITILITIASFISCEKQYIPDNELIIMCLDYPYNSKLPVPASNYYLQIEHMESPEPGTLTKFYKYLYNDTVATTTPIRFTRQEGLRYARYVITARKDSLSTFTEIIYKGGSIQIDMILKPQK